MPFEKGDAEFIASTVWGTVLSLTPEDKKAKARSAIRKACRKTWRKTKRMIRGKLSEDQMRNMESQRSSIVQRSESEEETEQADNQIRETDNSLLPPNVPLNPEAARQSENAAEEGAERLPKDQMDETDLPPIPLSFTETPGLSDDEIYRTAENNGERGMEELRQRLDGVIAKLDDVLERQDRTDSRLKRLSWKFTELLVLAAMKRKRDDEQQKPKAE